MKKAKIFLITGFAGCGKTTFVSKARELLYEHGKRVYIVNLDPAVTNMYYPVNLDIRDTVDFSTICKANNTGPNGGILLALNLFISKIDDLFLILEKKMATHDYILIDTPGQIEFLLWSASGDILSDNLKKLDKEAKLLYIIDQSKCTAENSGFFPSNVLFFSNIQQRLNIECMTIMNKTDINTVNTGTTTNQERHKDNNLNIEIMETFGNIFSNSKRFHVSSISGYGLHDVFN